MKIWPGINLEGIALRSAKNRKKCRNIPFYVKNTCKKYHLTDISVSIFLQTGLAEAVLWAPCAIEAAIFIHEKQSLQLQLAKGDYGYWKLSTGQIKPGDEYWFFINDGDGYPDPASLSYQKAVHGPSTAIGLLEYKWSDTDLEKHPPERIYYIGATYRHFFQRAYF